MFSQENFADTLIFRLLFRTSRFLCIKIVSRKAKDYKMVPDFANTCRNRPKIEVDFTLGITHIDYRRTSPTATTGIAKIVYKFGSIKCTAEVSQYFCKLDFLGRQDLTGHTKDKRSITGQYLSHTCL